MVTMGYIHVLKNSWALQLALKNRNEHWKNQSKKIER